MNKNIKTMGLGILCIVFAVFISACTTKPHVHQYKEVWSKDERGHWYAAVCDDVTEADITIHPHLYGEWQEITPSTEETEGSKKRICEECGYEETGIIEKLSHTHQYGEWQEIVPSTEETEGSKKRICEECGYEDFETIDKLPHVHQYEEVWSKDERGHWYAALCNDVIESEITIFPHKYGEWKEELPSTEETEGSKKRICEECGYEDFETVDKLPHVHQYEEVWSKDERGHWYAAVCDDVIESEITIHPHKYSDWEVTKEATYTEKGYKERYCSICNYKDQELLPKLEYLCIVKIIDWEQNVIDFYIDISGEYVLQLPLERIGYEFVKYVTEDGEEFPLSGEISEKGDIHIFEEWEVVETTTFEELKYRIENQVTEIYLNDDIDFKDTIYISKSLTLYATKEVHLLRNQNFIGDMFVLGETALGENSIFTNGPVEVTFVGQGDGKIILDGNSSNVIASGSVIFITNSATFNMTENVEIINCKKLGNERLSQNAYSLSHPAQVGGAAIIITYGTLNMYGGLIENCNVRTSEDPIVNATDKDISFAGGAIYNFGQVNMYNGIIRNCKATRAGAIYNYRITNLYGGKLENNFAEIYGGAIYLPDSQYAVLRLDSADVDNNPVIFANNSSNGSGGAIFGQTASIITMFNGIFRDNISYSNGGAINSCGGVVIYDALFEGNKAAAKGGAIYQYYTKAGNTERELLIYSATFNSNQASRGGAIGLYTDASYTKGTIGKIYNSNFNFNYAFATTTSAGGFPIAGDTTARDNNGNGGAIYATNKSLLFVCNSTFTENEAERYGGGIYISHETDALIENSIFEKNSVQINGGGIYVSDACSLNVTDSAFLENHSNNMEYGGGAIYFTQSQGVIKESQFEKNSAVNNGGAIAVYSNSSLALYASEFTLNSCGALGGAIYQNKSTIISTETTFSNNSSNKNGGALYITTNAEFKGDGLEFYSNQADTSGGAMYIYTDAQVSLGQYNSDNQNIFDSNEAGTYGGGIYISGAATLTIYNFSSSSNQASSGGFIYETTTNTLVNLINGESTDDTCTTTDAGPTLWSNTNKAILRILNYEYPDNALQGKSFSFTYIDEEDVKNLVWKEDVRPSEDIPSQFGVVPYPIFYSLEENKTLDNNFASLNTSVFNNINGKTVTVDSFIRRTNETLNNPIYGKGILIYQTIRYKMEHLNEDVYLSLTSFHLSVVTAVCIDPNSSNYGKMKSLYGTDADEEGFVRISALLIQAAKIGIHVTVVAQTDANPVDSGADYSFEEYFTSHLDEVCISEIGGKVSDYLTFRVARWTSYGDKAATDMMHLKSCYSSHYLDWNNQPHVDAIWLGSSNVDGITADGYNGNNGEQTGVIITNHAELYNVLFNYTNLLANYCSQEETDAFRYLISKRSMEQILLLESNQGNQILKEEQVVYIGTENDDIFELYFTSLGGNLNTWDTQFNPYFKYLNKLDSEESKADYIEFIWNNPKILNETNYLDSYFKKLAKIFLENTNKGNKLLLHVNEYSSDLNQYFTGLIENENIELLSINRYSYIWFHSKDMHMSYMENGTRQYVNILNSLNMHSGSAFYQANHILVIKENDTVGHSIYDLFMNITTYGQIVK